MSSMREWSERQYLEVEVRQIKRRRLDTSVHGPAHAFSDDRSDTLSPNPVSDAISVGTTNEPSPCIFSDAGSPPSTYLDWPCEGLQNAEQVSDHDAGVLLDDMLDPEIVCFGMITDIALRRAQATRYRGPEQYAPVIFRSTRVYTGPNEVYIGDVSADIAHALTQLESQNGMMIQPFCRHIFTANNDRIKGKSGVPDVAICTILYGPHNLAEAVGDFLQEFDLYLQDPSHCRWNVPYSNPHRLFDLGDIPKMTFDLNKSHEDAFESYEDPADILADLEHQGGLHGTKTPSAIKTELKP